MRYALALLLFGCGGVDPPLETTLDDLEFQQGFVDTNQDGLSYNDDPRAVRLSEFFAAGRPGTKIIMLNAAAGWCSSCMEEAGALPQLVADYEPRGVVVLTAVFQDQNGKPADAEFTKLWAETFQLPNPVLVDARFATSKYFDVSAMPVNMFVDAETREILTIATGAAPGNSPLRPYRELLDSYLLR